MLRRLFRAGTVSKLRIVPAPPAPDRSGLTLATVARNEASYIGEWARFHRLVGAERFVLYDDGSTDGTADALREAAGPDRVTVIPWHQRLFDALTGAELHNQVIAFAHALRNFGPAARWMAFIDVDEFIVPRAALTVPEVLDGLGDFGCLSLPWAMFGRCGHATRPEGGVLGNYLMRHRDPLSAPRSLKFKCIVDPARVTAIQVHQAEVEGRAEGINALGRRGHHDKRGSADFVTFEGLQLNHYYTRSDAELRAKITRGSNRQVEAATHLRRVMRNVEAIEEDTVEDRAAVDLLARHGAHQP